MRLPIIKNTTNIERVFILAAFVVIGFILSSIVAVAITMSHGNISEIGLLRISQISSQLLTFVFPPILYAILVKEKPMKSLGFNRIPLWSLLGLLMMYAILPINNVFAEWNAGLRLPESMSSIEEIMKNLQEQATIVSDKMLNVSNLSGLLINLIMIAGLAAFGEELLFRSLLQPFLIKLCKNYHCGIIITAAIFSFVHFEFYGFIPRLILGILLGYMFYYSRTIWVPMIMHFVNNGTAVVIYYLNNKGITNINIDTFGKTETLTLILSIAALIVMFTIVIRNSKKNLKRKKIERNKIKNL